MDTKPLRNIYRDGERDRWRVRFIIDGQQQNKIFYDHHYGGAFKALDAATNYRDRLLKAKKTYKLRLERNPETGLYGITKTVRRGREYYRLCFGGEDKLFATEDWSRDEIKIERNKIVRKCIGHKRCSKWLRSINEPTEV